MRWEKEKKRKICENVKLLFHAFGICIIRCNRLALSSCRLLTVMQRLMQTSINSLSPSRSSCRRLCSTSTHMIKFPCRAKWIYGNRIKGKCTWRRRSNATQRQRFLHSSSLLLFMCRQYYVRKIEFHVNTFCSAGRHPTASPLWLYHCVHFFDFSSEWLNTNTQTHAQVPCEHTKNAFEF